MRNYKVLFLGMLLGSLNSYALTHPKCPNEEGYNFINFRHRNPQNGGFVSNSAYVDDLSDSVFIGPDAVICGSSRIDSQAKIFGQAVITNSRVTDYAQVSENAVITNGAVIAGKANVKGDSRIDGSVKVSGNAFIGGNAHIFNESQDDLVEIGDDARVTGDATITGNARIMGSARVQGNSVISGFAIVQGNAIVSGCTTLNEGVVDSGVVNTAGNCQRVLTGNNFPESKHPYRNNEEDSQTYQLQGAKALEIFFDYQTNVETDRDFIIVNDTNKYTSNSLAGRKIRVMGDKVTIKLNSDHSNNFWGYKVIDIKGISQEQLNREEDERLRNEELRRIEERRRIEEQRKLEEAIQFWDDNLYSIEYYLDKSHESNHTMISGSSFSFYTTGISQLEDSCNISIELTKTYTSNDLFTECLEAKTKFNTIRIRDITDINSWGRNDNRGTYEGLILNGNRFEYREKRTTVNSSYVCSKIGNSDWSMPRSVNSIKLKVSHLEIQQFARLKEAFYKVRDYCIRTNQ